MAATNAVTLFFLLASPCIILSLCIVTSEHFKTTYVDVPQLAVICLMFAGLAVMAALLRTPKQSAAIDMDDPLIRRHYFHTCTALLGIAIFYGEAIILAINHFIAGFDCLPNWSLCDNAYIVRYHAVDLLFHAVRLVFIGFECVLCYRMVVSSMRRINWLPYGVAIIQSANIAICFQTIVSETYAHHHDITLEINFLSTSCWKREQSDSWSDCPYSGNSTNNSTDCCWPKHNQLLLWLETSNPALYSIVIEFSLLIGEIMLEKLYSGEHVSVGNSHTANTDEQNVHNDNSGINNGELADNDTRPTGNHNGPTTFILPLYIHIIFHCKTAVVILVAAIMVVFNDAIVMVAIFIDMQWNAHGEEESVDHIRNMWLSSAGFLLMACSTIVGLKVLQPFDAHAHSSSLDYLTLVSSVGPFLLISKRLVECILNSAEAIYIIQPLLHSVQVLLQIWFLYKVKDVRLEKVTVGLRLYIVYFILACMSLFNYGTWQGYSLAHPEKYADIGESSGWQTIASIIGPLNAFFRFSSALVFTSTFMYIRSLIRSQYQLASRDVPLESRDESLLQTNKRRPEDMHIG